MRRGRRPGRRRAAAPCDRGAGGRGRPPRAGRPGRCTRRVLLVDPGHPQQGPERQLDGRAVHLAGRRRGHHAGPGPSPHRHRGAEVRGADPARGSRRRADDDALVERRDPAPAVALLEHLGGLAQEQLGLGAAVQPEPDLRVHRRRPSRPRPGGRGRPARRRRGGRPASATGSPPAPAPPASRGRRRGGGAGSRVVSCQCGDPESGGVGQHDGRPVVGHAADDRRGRPPTRRRRGR